MKKSSKAKSPKSSRKPAAEEVPETELPNMVTAMTKLVERLESVEQKMDQVLGRLSSLPSEVRNAVQQRPNHSQPQQQRPQQGHGNSQRSHSQPHPQHQAPRQNPVSSHASHAQMQSQGNAAPRRSMFQAVCADCQKSCEVPFKPSDRPVYCKECFAARKSSRKPQQVSAPLSARGLASAYVNQKAGYPPPAAGVYRPQGQSQNTPAASISGNTAVLNPPKAKASAKTSAKSKKKK